MLWDSASHTGFECRNRAMAVFSRLMAVCSESGTNAILSHEATSEIDSFITESVGYFARLGRHPSTDQSRLTVWGTVYTVQHMASARSSKPKRRNCPINVLVRHDQKRRLESEASRTHVNQSAMVRKALDILFEQMDKGQLTLGLSDLEQGVRS